MIDITQLEREVNEFHSNIVASTQLMETLQRAIGSIRDSSNAITQCSNAIKTERKVSEEERALLRKTASDTISELVTAGEKHAQGLELATEELEKRISDGNAYLVSELTVSMENAFRELTAKAADLSHSIEAFKANSKEQTDSLETALEKCVQQLSTENRTSMREALRTLSENGEKLSAEMNTLTETMAEITGELDNQSKALSASFDHSLQLLEKQNREELTNAIAEMKSIGDGYLFEIDRVSDQFEERSGKIEKQHQNLLKKMDDCQLELLYEELCSFSRTTKKKLSMLTAGVAIAVILAVVGLFL